MIKMKRLLDVGIKKLEESILEMGSLASESVEFSINSYLQGQDSSKDALKKSKAINSLNDDINELAFELIARYQPVASDLRFIKSCFEIAYTLSRFGRYAYDITLVTHEFGKLKKCDKSAVEKAGKHTVKMINASLIAFKKRDANANINIHNMDKKVDEIYKNFIAEIRASTKDEDIIITRGCSVSASLILRYVERIADHATYIAESVSYIKTAKKYRRR